VTFEASTGRPPGTRPLPSHSHLLMPPPSSSEPPLSPLLTWIKVICLSSESAEWPAEPSSAEAGPFLRLGTPLFYFLRLPLVML
jgi:hypothetical protein